MSTPAQTPPTAPTKPTTIGTATNYGLFLKVNAAYSTVVNDPDGAGTTNPDYITYFANFQPNPQNEIARQVMQDGNEYAEKVNVQMGFSVDIYGEPTDTKIAEILAAAVATGDAGKASWALVFPGGNGGWYGWAVIDSAVPNTDPRGLKYFTVTCSPLGEAAFQAAV